MADRRELERMKAEILQHGAIEHSLKVFLQNQTSENYLRAHQMLTSSELYDPAGKDLQAMNDASGNQDWEGVIAAFQEHFPNRMLDPYANAAVAHAWKQLGEDKKFEVFFRASVDLCKGIALTGDGSQQRPFVVAHTDTVEYFVESHLEKNTGDATLREENGKRYVVVPCEDGGEVWFDGSCVLRGQGASHSPMEAESGISKEELEAELEAAGQNGMKTGCVVSTVLFVVACGLLGSSWFSRFGGTAVLVGIVVAIAVCIAIPFVTAKQSIRKRLGELDVSG